MTHGAGRAWSGDSFAWSELSRGARAAVIASSAWSELRGSVATLSLEPGLFAAEMAQSVEQTLGDVIVERDGVRKPIPLGSVPAVAMSELLRELAAAFGEKG